MQYESKYFNFRNIAVAYANTIANMDPSMASAAAALKQNPNLIEAVGNMWDNLTELSKTNPERYLV